MRINSLISPYLVQATQSFRIPVVLFFLNCTPKALYILNQNPQTHSCCSNLSGLYSWTALTLYRISVSNFSKMWLVKKVYIQSSRGSFLQPQPSCRCLLRWFKLQNLSYNSNLSNSSPFCPSIANRAGYVRVFQLERAENRAVLNENLLHTHLCEQSSTHRLLALPLGLKLCLHSNNVGRAERTERFGPLPWATCHFDISDSWLELFTHPTTVLFAFNNIYHV